MKRRWSCVKINNRFAENNKNVSHGHTMESFIKLKRLIIIYA